MGVICPTFTSNRILIATYDHQLLLGFPHCNSHERKPFQFQNIENLKQACENTRKHFCSFSTMSAFPQKKTITPQEWENKNWKMIKPHLTTFLFACTGHADDSTETNTPEYVCTPESKCIRRTSKKSLQNKNQVDFPRSFKSKRQYSYREDT